MYLFYIIFVMKHRLPVIALSSVLLAGCANVDFNQSAQLKIQELEKQASIAKTACDNYETLNKDITNLKGYITNQKDLVSIEATGGKGNKPQSCTKWYAFCVDNKNVWVFWEVCYEDYKFIEGAGIFENYDWAYANEDYKCLIKGNESDLNQMLKERPVF